jgi:hypothetical protein
MCQRPTEAAGAATDSPTHAGVTDQFRAQRPHRLTATAPDRRAGRLGTTPGGRGAPHIESPDHEDARNSSPPVRCQQTVRPLWPTTAACPSSPERRYRRFM